MGTAPAREPTCCSPNRVVLRLTWNETAWVSIGLLGAVSLIVLTSQGVMPGSQVTFLMELVFPALCAILVVPMATVDRDYGMEEMLNAAATPSSVRVSRRLAYVMAIPVALTVPFTLIFCAIAGIFRTGQLSVPPFTLALSSMSLVLFMSGVAFLATAATGALAVGYSAVPAVFIGVLTLKRFLSGAFQPFPIAASLGRDLAAFSAEPICDTGLFWANRIGYGAVGIALIALGVIIMHVLRRGY